MIFHIFICNDVILSFFSTQTDPVQYKIQDDFSKRSHFKYFDYVPEFVFSYLYECLQ